MSVVVPVYNEGPLVDDAIEQLLRQVRPEDQIVVVDDCSTDDTLSRARAWATSRPDIVTLVARDRNGGVGAARNSGVAACRNDGIAFTDAGCLLDPLWLESLRSALDEEPPPDFVAGTYRVSSRSTVEAAVAVACYPDVSEAVHPSLLARVYGRIFGRAFDATRPAGRSMAFRRAAYLQVGGFREDMAATEDVDFSRAVARAGLHCVLAADASMTWFQDPTLRGTARMYARYGRGDSASADRQAVARDLVRAGALLGAPLMAWSGRRWVRGAVAGGAVAYLSLPLARARRHDHPLRVAVAVPVVLMVKDVAKAYGCLAGLGSRLLPRSGHGGGG
jgi:glycosyltransferase involved in cell wall biosynthesis